MTQAPPTPQRVGAMRSLTPCGSMRSTSVSTACRSTVDTGKFPRSRRSRGMGSQQDIGRVQECLDAASHCEQRAALAIDPTAKATFEEVARCWHELARCWRELPKQRPEEPPTTH